MIKRRVFVTGMGVVTPFGIGIPVFSQGLFTGASAVSPITSFDVQGLPTRFAAQVPFATEALVEHLADFKGIKAMCRSARFEAIAAEEALLNSGLILEQEDSHRVGVSMGAGGLGLLDQDYLELSHKVIVESTPGNGVVDTSLLWEATCHSIHPLTPLKALPNIPTANLAIQFNARGPCQTLSTACVSGAQAVGEAFRLIRHGYADVMIAGAADSMVNVDGMIGFSTLGVLTRNNDDWATASRPFDRHRDGFVLGEGAAVFILESEEVVAKRNASPLAELLGYANCSDAFRLTDPALDARGSIQAMMQAIADADARPGEIDYINAHGTSTQLNDRAETLAIKRLFGYLPRIPPVSSTKSMIGHLIAAAGAVEFAACLLAIEKQTIPPTINYETPDPECDLDYVPNTSRSATIRTVLTNSFGFGGQNACLVIGSA